MIKKITVTRVNFMLSDVKSELDKGAKLDECLEIDIRQNIYRKFGWWLMDYRDDRKFSLLHHAVNDNNVDLATFCILHGANYKDETKLTYWPTNRVKVSTPMYCHQHSVECILKPLLKEKHGLIVKRELGKKFNAINCNTQCALEHLILEYADYPDYIEEWSEQKLRKALGLFLDNSFQRTHYNW